MSFNGEGEQPVHPTPEGGITPQGAPYGEVTHYGEVQTPSSSSKKWIGAAAAAAVVVALTVGGVVAVNALGGGGAQPEDVLPANAIAFSKLDLNPSAGQKVAAFRLISKFPKAKDKVTSEDTSIKESIFGSIFTGKDSLGLDYKKDVEPWLGDRIGVGVFPDIDGDKKPEVGVAIAFTDRDAAKAALDKAIANTTKKQAENKVTNTPGQVPGYAFAEDDYMIVSDTAAHASALVEAGKGNSLAKSKYAEDVKRLGSDQIAVAWVDIAAAYKAVPKDLMAGASGQAGLTPGSLTGLNDPSKVSGRFVIGLHADPSFLEVTGKAIELKGLDSSVMPDAGTGSGLIESFPSDVFGAATITGLGKAAGAFYTSFTAGAGDPMGVKSELHNFGIDSAQDIETLLGAETGVVVGGTAEEPEIAVRTRGSDADAALAIANKVIAASRGFAPGLITASKTTGPDGIVVGMGSGLTAAMSDKSGSKLGGTEAFRLVAPDAGKAVGTEYVNLSKIISMLAKDNPKDAAVLEPLSALGVTATGGAEPTLRIRLSFK